jgi:transmembrane sensor
MTDDPDVIPFFAPSLQSEAYAWVIRLTSGEPATVEDTRELNAWRARSKAHEAALREAAAFWRALGPPAVELDAEFHTSSPRRAPTRRMMVIGGGVAASVAGALIVRPPLGLWPSLNDLVQDAAANYRTAPGQQQGVALAPDVSVVLNTRTRLARDASEPQRAATLLNGEALFTVRPTAAVFSVRAGAGSAGARDAVFNIHIADATTSVTCLSGGVEIQHRAGRANVPAGAQVSYTDDSLGPVRPVDTALTVAWRRRLLIFRDMPLSQVVVELNRYRAGRILLLNGKLADRRINGVFHIDRPQDVLTQFTQGYGARLDSLPGGVVVVT